VISPGFLIDNPACCPKATADGVEWGKAMDIQNLFLAVLWLFAAPMATAADTSSTASGWQPPVSRDSSAPPALDTAHLYTERLHERWRPPAIDWSVPREFAISMMCDLGLITLALMDCDHWAASDVSGKSAPDVLILSPVRPAPPGGSAGGPDFHDLRRRSIEERMHSI